MKLRMRGHSYNEIQHALDIPKSTLSNWFRHLVLSREARERLDKRIKIGTATLIKRNKMQTHSAWHKAKVTQSEAAQEIHALVINDVKLLGTALYWAEGYKRLKIRDGKERSGHPISFVNADADMARFFVRFLIDAMDVPREKIRLGMRLYAHMNEKEMLRYWSDVLQLPSENFHKTTWLVSISSQRKRPFNILPQGTIQIQVADTEKFHRLLGWIEGVKNQLKYDTVGERLGSSVVERPPESSGLSTVK